MGVNRSAHSTDPMPVPPLTFNETRFIHGFISDSIFVPYSFHIFSAAIVLDCGGALTVHEHIASFAIVSVHIFLGKYCLEI